MRHRADHLVPPGRRRRVGVGAAVVLLIAAFVVAVVVSAAAGGGAVAIPTSSASALGLASSTAEGSALDTPAPEKSASASSEAEVFVHVTGAVHTPGLVALAPGTRVVDAVTAAGGLSEDADPSAINLARRIQDGEQLRVPKLGESPPPADPAQPSPSQHGQLLPSGSQNSLLDLNAATQQQLETLPRIGPALAQRILDWRASNGRFRSVTDLLQVTGIGQKILDGVKDRVTV